jgi:hypothetical protein
MHSVDTFRLGGRHLGQLRPQHSWYAVPYIFWVRVNHSRYDRVPCVHFYSYQDRGGVNVDIIGCVG